MGGRIKKTVLLGLIFTVLFPKTLYAQNIINKSLLVEQAKGRAPSVKVYLTGTDVSKELDVTGDIAGIPLIQNGDIESFDETGESIRFIVLMDNSGSINIKQFEEAKKQLIEMRKKLKNKDEMQLFTVGTMDIAADKTDIFERMANASEKEKISSDCEKIENIKYISGVEAKTILYRSLNEVLEAQTSQIGMECSRTVILLITDGEDDSDELKGRNNDSNATLENVKDSLIPVYGILLNSTAKKPNEEKIKFTKDKLLDSRNCNGYYYSCSTETEAQIVSNAFQTINDVIRKKTFVVKLTANTNKALNGKNFLELAVGNQSVPSVMLDYSDYDRDDDAPAVIGLLKKTGRNTIAFTLEDENGINLRDAEETSHYTIHSESTDQNWTIQQVGILQDGRNANITLTLNESDFLNGDYSLLIDGIRDESQDENSMKEVKISFSIEDGLDPSTVKRKELIQKYWWISLLVVLIVLGIIGFMLLRRRAESKEGYIDGADIDNANKRLVRMTVTDRLGTKKELEYNVEGSVFVGRSDICEIFFDDDKLSRQHFVIEVTEMGCYVEDLDSTNSTFVNNTKITNKRLLVDGDIISAGRETFVIHLDKEQIQNDLTYDYSEA